jgi:hypothetical protein
MSYRATYSKNKNGDGFNARIVCDPEDIEDFEEGTPVKISLKDPSKPKVKRVIERVIWQGPGDREATDDRESEVGKHIILAALKPDGGPSGGKSKARKSDDDIPF